jgi:glutamate racemase
MNHPIGIFDSGVGGLTLLDKLVKALPEESFEYYGDSGNCPYGTKTIEEIMQHTTHIMDYLMQKNCKMIIVACNTITTNIIEQLRSIYPVPIIGMEPGTKPAYAISTSKRIGILATAGTINGQLYNKTLEQFSEKAFFISQVGAGLVELIEQNSIESVRMKEQLQLLLQPMIDSVIDTLVLGCTHYNYLTAVLTDIFPYPIKIVDTRNAVTNQVKRILHEKELISTEQHRIVTITTTGDLELLKQILMRLQMHNAVLNLNKAVPYNM